MHVIKGEQSEIDYRKETKYGNSIPPDSASYSGTRFWGRWPAEACQGICVLKRWGKTVFVYRFISHCMDRSLILLHISRVYYRMRFHISTAEPF